MLTLGLLSGAGGPDGSSAGKSNGDGAGDPSGNSAGGPNGDGAGAGNPVEPVEVDLPQIRNRSSFEEHVYSIYLSVEM
ncbi:MAG: hypothetical protein ACOX4J_09010 [Anaerovoracaceae bacterium]